jgi:hypothetical protein
MMISVIRRAGTIHRFFVGRCFTHSIFKAHPLKSGFDLFCCADRGIFSAGEDSQKCAVTDNLHHVGILQPDMINRRAAGKVRALSGTPNDSPKNLPREAQIVHIDRLTCQFGREIGAWCFTSGHRRGEDIFVDPCNNFENACLEMSSSDRSKVDRETITRRGDSAQGARRQA